MSEQEKSIDELVMEAVIDYMSKRFFNPHHKFYETIPNYDVIRSSEQVSKALENVETPDRFLRRAIDSLMEEGLMWMKTPGPIYFTEKSVSDVFDSIVGEPNETEKIQNPIGYVFAGDKDALFKAYQQAVRDDDL